MNRLWRFELDDCCVLHLLMNADSFLYIPQEHFCPEAC